MSLLSAILGSAVAVGSSSAAANSHRGVTDLIQRKVVDKQGPWDLPVGKRLSPSEAGKLSPTVRSALASAAARTPFDQSLPDIGVGARNPHGYLFRPADNVIQLGTKKGTALLTHELGHLEQLKASPSRYKIMSASSNTFGSKAPLAALTAGGVAYVLDQDVVNPGVAALSAGLLASLPSIAHEGDAWRRGNKILEGHLGSSGRKFNRLRSLKTMTPWMATYAAAAAAPSAVFGISDFLRKKLRESNEIDTGDTDGPALHPQGEPSEGSQ